MIVTEAEALATFHRWANARRGRAAIVSFPLRYAAAAVLTAISNGCTLLARRVTPALSNAALE